MRGFVAGFRWPSLDEAKRRPLYLVDRIVRGKS
jgi:hypothetical protein